MTWGEDVLQLIQQRMDLGPMVLKALKDIHKQLLEANEKTKGKKIALGAPSGKNGTYFMLVGGQTVKFTINDVKTLLRQNYVRDITQQDINLVVGELVQRRIGIV